MARRTLFVFFCLAFIAIPLGPAWGEQAEFSQATETCLECHTSATPGIVADWKNSRHAQISPAEAMKQEDLHRKVSAEKIPPPLADAVVGCAECHGLNPASHSDTFDHEGEQVHVVVTPSDCAVCHPTEADQYGRNKMSHAYGNLAHNPLFMELAKTTNGGLDYLNGRLTQTPPDRLTQADSCFNCHGTIIEVTGTTTRETDFGDFEFPILKGWPNQGVGRINPDQSRGSCASCHARHQFSITVARQPYTCSQCHKGPDVPAYKVYLVSKHGSIFSSKKSDWDFRAVPWVIGRDFTAPTCAACHASLLVDEEGQLIAPRTHQMNDRLPWRLMGLIYAHPQPGSPDTSRIKNKAGLALPTELTGEPVSQFLVSPQTQAQRTESMQGICLACHTTAWVEGHWARLMKAIETTNAMTLTATRIMMQAWDQGAAKGPAQKASPFDEAIERKWVEQWLFFANSVRLASAMAGADYGAFADGRWFMTRRALEMADWLGSRLQSN